MAFIPMIAEVEATGELKKLYDTYRAPWGGVDNILKIHSLLPHTLKPHYDLYKAIMFGAGPLTRRQREMIATVVSHANQCLYCVHHHSDALLRLTKDRTLADALRTNYRSADLPQEERQMLEYAEHLTKHPNGDHAPLVRNLKASGFSDEALLHITLVVAYFNFVNRIANGLSVELEAYWKEDGYSDPQQPMSHDDHREQRTE